MIGRESDGLVQPLSILFTVEGIEPDTGFECCHEEDHRDLGGGREYLDCCRKACESGELPAAVNIVRLYQTGRTGEHMVNATQMNRVFPLDPRALADAEYELRTQVRQVVRFLQNNVPGFANVRVNGSGTTTGVRESRRVTGDYVLTADNLFAGRRFDDAVVTDAHFCIDIHNPDGAGQAERDGRPYEPQPYEIPYRCLTAAVFDDLLTTGRCISGDHRAHASYRVMRICMAMGHAAGIAAALMSENRVSSREIDVRRVQDAVGIQKTLSGACLRILSYLTVAIVLSDNQMFISRIPTQERIRYRWCGVSTGRQPRTSFDSYIKGRVETAKVFGMDNSGYSDGDTVYPPLTKTGNVIKLSGSCGHRP